MTKQIRKEKCRRNIRPSKERWTEQEIRKIFSRPPISNSTLKTVEDMVAEILEELSKNPKFQNVEVEEFTVECDEKFLYYKGKEIDKMPMTSPENFNRKNYKRAND